MSVLIVLGALAFLMVAAYRGYSVILFAPIAALGAVLLTDAAAVAPVFSGLFMEKFGGFVKLYFPVFMLGAVFGKLIEISGFSTTIVTTIIRLVGRNHAMLSIVVVTALLTYGGVSVFVVVFAIYPFAATMFRTAGIPKRLIPATIALGALTFTMDALPGTPQVQNIIPTSFFGTDAWAAPLLGIIGGIFTFTVGFIYLEWCRGRAAADNEDYGASHFNEPEEPSDAGRTSPLIAILPLVIVGLTNLLLSKLIPTLTGGKLETPLAGLDHPIVTQIASRRRYLGGRGCADRRYPRHPDLQVWPFAHNSIVEGTKQAIGGAMLATMNTASEFGFGSVIAALPGFITVKNGLDVIGNPLVHEAVTVTTLAGIARLEHRAASASPSPPWRPSFPNPAAPREFRRKCCTGSPRWPAAAWTLCPITGRSSPCSPSPV